MHGHWEARQALSRELDGPPNWAAIPCPFLE